MTDLSAFLKGAVDRHTETVLLSPDPDAMSAAAVAAAAASGDTLADGEAEATEAKEAAAASAWEFVVSAVPRAMWTRLRDDHPATSDQQEAAKAEGHLLAFNPATFPPTAIGACLRSARNPDDQRLEFPPPTFDADGAPDVDTTAAELAQKIWDQFPLGETERLWNAVIRLNAAAPAATRLASFGSGSSKTRTGGR